MNDAHLLTAPQHTNPLAGTDLPRAAHSTVYLQDCVEGMRRYPDNYFDLAVVDPPYGIGASRPTKKPDCVKQANGSFIKVKSNQYSHKNWDDKPFSHQEFKEIQRVSKNQIIWGCNFFDFHLKGGRIVWDKLNRDTDQFDAEIAFNSIGNRIDVVRFKWSGMIQGVYAGKDVVRANKQQGDKRLNEKRIHPTQKPVKLYDWILQKYANPDDKILDTHLGSQSSRIAAAKAGLHFTGFELDAEYFEQGNKRFEQFIKQTTLF